MLNADHWGSLPCESSRNRACTVYPVEFVGNFLLSAIMTHSLDSGHNQIPRKPTLLGDTTRIANVGDLETGCGYLNERTAIASRPTRRSALDQLPAAASMERSASLLSSRRGLGLTWPWVRASAARNTYPTPRTVRRYSGRAGSNSILPRNRLT